MTLSFFLSVFVVEFAHARCAHVSRVELFRAPIREMNRSSRVEFCLIVEGSYLSESEAEHALRDPFIEEWVEETGRFRIHNLMEMEIAPGVMLGSLGVLMLDDEGVFEIASADPEHPLTEHKARAVAEALRRHDMFDEITVEPRDNSDEQIEAQTAGSES